MLGLVALLLARQIPLPLATLPFEHEPGRIWLKATLNGAPIDALLDTGANANIADDTLPVVAQAKKGKPLAIPGGGGVTAKFWRTEGLEIAFPGTPVSTTVDVATSMAFTTLEKGRLVQASLGSGFFDDYVVQIDYVNQRVKIYDSESYLAPAGYDALPIKFKDRVPLVEAKFQLPGLPEKKVVLTFDTGAPVGIQVASRMVRKDKLAARFANLPETTGWGSLGGRTKMKPVEGFKGQLGTTPLQGTAILSLDSAPDGPYDLFVGDELLSHFDVVIDYSHSRLYLHPNGK